MDLMLRKVILRLSFGGGMGMIKSMMMARWSKMWRLRLETWWRMRPAEQTRPRMWPRQWVGKLTCWVKWKQWSSYRRSIALLQFGSSMWKLKSPSRRIEGDMADSWVTKAARSERKEWLGLGGRWMMVMTMGVGPGSLRAFSGKTDSGGRVNDWFGWRGALVSGGVLSAAICRGWRRVAAEGVCGVNSQSHGAECTVCWILSASMWLPVVVGWMPSDLKKEGRFQKR